MDSMELALMVWVVWTLAVVCTLVWLRELEALLGTEKAYKLLEGMAISWSSLTIGTFVAQFVIKYLP